MSFLLPVLVFLAVAITQALAGGRQVVLSLPGYMLLALAAIIGWWPWRRQPIPRGAMECLGAAGVFCGYVSLRAIFSPESYLARPDLYGALGAMALYLLVALNCTSSRSRLFLVGALLALALANCAIGAVQFFKGQQFMPFPFLPRPDYGVRASGFYGYPNHLSGFLEMVLLLGLSVTFWSRWPAWAKILAGYVSAMCLMGILVTGSRGGYISGTIGLIVFALLSLVLIGKLAKGQAFALLAVGVILVGGGIVSVRGVASKSTLVGFRSGETLQVDASRMRLWEAAWKQFRLQPVIGTGSGTYRYYGRQFRSTGLQTDPVHAHNEFFELLAEYGILGILAAVIFLETHLRSGWTALNRRLRPGAEHGGLASNSLALNVGALSAAAACLVHSLLDYNLHMPANLLTAALVFGLLATPGEGPATASERESGFPPFLRLALPGLGILLIACIAPTAPAEYFAERTRRILADWKRAVSIEPNLAMEALAQRGLVSDPHHPELHFALGEAKIARAELATDAATKETLSKEAVESYRRALEAAPGDVRLVLALGVALDALGLFSESQPLFARALTIDPNRGLTHTYVARHYLLQGRLDEAEAEYRLGIKLGAGPAASVGIELVEEARQQGGIVPPPASPPAVN